MRAANFVLSLGLLIFLSACAHAPPAPTPGCALAAYPLLVSPNHPKAPGDPPSLEEAVEAALVDSPALPQVLALSGGSQHGAFGAGYFNGLRTVPTYQVVTGVSTGALQSTLIFLANQPVPRDRHYPPHMTRPGLKPGTSNLDDLYLAYSIEKESDLVDIGSFGELGGVVRGSIGRFGPLRGLAEGLISDETIRQVAAEGLDNKRMLLVGVVDVDDGQGYAIDLTELAGRSRDNEMEIGAIRRCFVDALVASSSVPLAVPPVTLETRTRTDIRTGRHDVRRDLYIDGGARFGLFWEQLRKVTDTTRPAAITGIVNGRLYGSDWTSKGKKVEKWSALSLGLRAVGILENQVYRFSVAGLESSVVPGGSLKLAFIANNCLPAGRPDCVAGTLPGEGPPEAFQYLGKSCGAWSDEDDRLDHPTEFHPRYMRCLLAYGKHRGEGAGSWNLKLPTAP